MKEFLMNLEWGEILSFSFVLVVFGPFAFKKFKAFAKSKSLEIEENINESLTLRDKADDLLHHYHYKVKTKKKEFKKMKEEAEAEIESLEEDYKESLKKTKEKLEKKMQNRLSQMKKQEDKNIKTEFLEKTFEQAEKNILKSSVPFEETLDKLNDMKL